MKLDRLALPVTEHGGTDDGPPLHWDFSTNANPLGPPPAVADALARADRHRYPEPGYRALREQVACWHGVDAARVVPAGSAGEFIWRLTLALRQCGGARRVWVPQPGYGEYAAAARALGAEPRAWSGTLGAGLPALRPGDLLWICAPCNPTGHALAAGELEALLAHAEEAGAVAALDLAYAPLRLDGAAPPAAASRAWRLWSPNKACGLTGVRGAYAIAPDGAEADADALRRFAPAWVLGAEGAAMVEGFCTPQAQERLAADLRVLAGWKEQLCAALRARGWQLRDSVTPFLLARPPGPVEAAAGRHAAWRARGLKLRDAASFGLPGWVRLSAQPPEAQAALLATWDEREETR
ncbi:aminotransferase class I/II-fold pyridoxal phosphate-dependent enzyme [Caldimonas tepidiphila]|uniref:aminotransferase class I/II-fold pyridoxal phosphate-dependent enzyme n=1 Tax=Caldimonas tepidiphila TaxID=2315841 RepID=UPI000E5BBD98|nr:aminotransferase class I/II-fold pyridoxal phosphate-dependent enzyme [Caldimonas tepidiphila]